MNSMRSGDRGWHMYDVWNASPAQHSARFKSSDSSALDASPIKPYVSLLLSVHPIPALSSYASAQVSYIHASSWL